MIEVRTARFGVLKVPEDNIVYFPEGLLGFSRLKKYVLLDYKDTYVKLLQSLDDPDITFGVINVFEIEPSYEFKIPESVLRLLELKRIKDAEVLVILRVEGEKIFVNFQIPLVINPINRKGVQIIVENASVKVYNMH